MLAAVGRLAFSVQALDMKLDQVLDLLQPGQVERLVFSAVLDGVLLEDITMATLSDSQRMLVTIAPVDKKGKPALLDGPATWAGSDDTVFTVTVGTLDPAGNIVPAPAGDPGLSAVIEGVSAGSGRVTVTGDANMDPAGTTAITGVLDITVTPGEAVTINITAAAPVDVP